ncbi:hypothetical protein B7P43_G07270 [Cryptotermes secundus]|uniref:Tox-ART-HYD1 domain-containing protein n=1 Tax=Cryptotermes secundus TaxID=105785 RepID=A0A2J7QMV5_9NEOP|nr:hypothetical protein B7P43_G07270 [Cryptotermes secundus]
MVYLYHYTSSDGYAGILVDGVIRRSTDTNRDAVLGKGVYLTALPPWTDDMKLLKNNWDGSSERRLLEKLDNLDYYIRFDSRDLPNVKRAPGKRDIWMVSYDIVLEEVPHEVCVRGNNVAVATRYGYL